MTLTILQAELAHGPCPACHQPISYDYAIDPDQLREIVLSASILDNDPVGATVIGIRIYHDCIPDDHG